MMKVLYSPEAKEDLQRIISLIYGAISWYTSTIMKKLAV